MSSARHVPVRLALPCGIAICLATLLIATVDINAALTGWLSAFVLTSSLPIGALFLVLLLRLVPGKWRLDLQRQSEQCLWGLPVLVICVLPILAGTDHIYGWTTATLQGMKSAYLEHFFFAGRSVVLLLAGCLLGFLLLARPTSRPLAVVGMIAFVLAHGLLATDWVVSLDADFYSSSFGLYFLCVQTLTAFCFLIVFRLSTARAQHPEILGGLLLTGILLWGYFAFLQYLVIWSDNLPAGAAWYQKRGFGLWHVSEYGMSILRLLPAFLLLFGPVRRGRRWLMVLSSIVMLGSVVEMAWLVLPSMGGNFGLGIIVYIFSAVGMGLLISAALGTLGNFGKKSHAASSQTEIAG